MRTFVINLDRSPERLEMFDTEARRVGVPYRRFPAIDGTALSEAQFNAVRAERFRFQPINRGETAVFLSHRALWRRLLETDEQAMAVFEDDVVMSEALPRFLSALDRNAPVFDVIKLETTFRKVVVSGDHACVGDIELSRLHSWHGGAAGYVVSRTGARKLLAACEKLADPVDQLVFNPMSPLHGQLTILQAEPALCAQRDLLAQKQGGQVLGSTIGRHANRRTVLRHGLLIDIRRNCLKLAEKWRASRLARKRGMQVHWIGFDGAQSLAPPSAK